MFLITVLLTVKEKSTMVVFPGTFLRENQPKKKKCNYHQGSSRPVNLVPVQSPKVLKTLFYQILLDRTQIGMR